VKLTERPEACECPEGEDGKLCAYCMCMATDEAWREFEAEAASWSRLRVMIKSTIAFLDQEILSLYRGRRFTFRTKTDKVASNVNSVKRRLQVAFEEFEAIHTPEKLDNIGVHEGLAGHRWERRQAVKMCQEHWDELKRLIDERGLRKFVAKDGEEAAKRMVRDINLGDELASYEPLLGAHNALITHCLATAGLRLLAPDEKGQEQCPLCVVIKECPCGEGDKCGYRQWPTLAADGQVEIGKRLGLIGAG
jgi:hypothetical protein